MTKVIEEVAAGGDDEMRISIHIPKAYITRGYESCSQTRQKGMNQK